MAAPNQPTRGTRTGPGSTSPSLDLSYALGPRQQALSILEKGPRRPVRASRWRPRRPRRHIR